MGMLFRVASTSAKAIERCNEASLQTLHSQIPGPASALLPDENRVLIKLRLDYDYGGLRSPFQPSAKKKAQAAPFRGPIPALPRRLETHVSQTLAVGWRSRRTRQNSQKLKS
jgi:hypothetical protein